MVNNFAEGKKCKTTMNKKKFNKQAKLDKGLGLKKATTLKNF